MWKKVAKALLTFTHGPHSAQAVAIRIFIGNFPEWYWLMLLPDLFVLVL
jgi:hypothetical protein